MDEMIVELLNKYSKDGTININVFEFSDAIQTACKAQRNACAREWTNTHFDYEIGCNILNAEIRKEDYE